ncbi:MAG: symmetrical bis(5'-nucleosyl)-tetraphosphatase [Rhodocyclaceae bacterium]|nr:symmetrical bis(5'-nucleosyl)-tetraphosphatase [Rhodocyclaceae bacterium]
MSTYVVGDLQGCYLTLQALLRKIRFVPSRDRLWFVGDLVNRGNGSLECLRFVKQLGNAATVVLGNHDLHLLAVAEGFARPGKLDTLRPILDAADSVALLDWLRHRPLLHIDGKFAMVHAGLMPQWTWEKSISLAREVESSLRSAQYRATLAAMYGDQPIAWRDSLKGGARSRFVINTMTRMRTLTPAGEHQHKYKAGISALPAGLRAWFDVPTVRRAERTLFSGHWSAIGYVQRERTVNIDTGCIWGGELTAVRLEDRKRFAQVSVEQPDSQRHVQFDQD